jgi:hypothetical protein
MTSRSLKSARPAPFPTDHATAGYPTSPVAGARSGRMDACAMERWDRMVEECGIRGEVP